MYSTYEPWREKSHFEIIAHIIYSWIVIKLNNFIMIPGATCTIWKKYYATPLNLNLNRFVLSLNKSSTYPCFYKPDHWLKGLYSNRNKTICVSLLLLGIFHNHMLCYFKMAFRNHSNSATKWENIKLQSRVTKWLEA